MTGLVVAGVVTAGLVVVGVVGARLATPSRHQPAPSRRLRTRLWRGAVRVLVVVIGAFLVLRAGFVLATDDLSRPETYRMDWGGPHLAGVMAVHVGPGVLVLLLSVLRLRRRRNTRQRPAQRNAHITRERS